MPRQASFRAAVTWLEELPCSVTVCDKRYRILYMNKRSADANREEGGKALIGKSLMDCHPPAAQEKLRKVMASGKPNIYTVRRGTVRKMIYQGHWKQRGRISGLIELSFELPPRVPNHIRE